MAGNSSVSQLQDNSRVFGRPVYTIRGLMRSGFFQGRAVQLALVFVVGGIALTPVGWAVGQEEAPEVRLTVDGGIDGWVDHRWPMKIHAQIETDILLVGELLVVQGQELARFELEVPANGARTYEVVTAPPADQGAILLRVIPEGAEDNEPAASAFFRPRVARNEILVGVVGPSRLEQVLGEVRSAVSGSPITPVGVANAEKRLEEGEFHQLSYLVLDRPRPLPPATVSWLKGGGRLITTTTALQNMGLEASLWGGFPGMEAEVEWYGVGEGEVLALESLSGQSARLWASLLRPVPLAVDRQFGFRERPLSLTQAALAVETETPGYPWLPLVVVGYAVVVGPVNLWILRRRRKVEWAWFTIPAVGLLGVVAFWIVGASGVNQAFWSHGTVQVAGPSAEARSAIVAATSRARTLEISFNQGWDTFPENPEWISGGSAQPNITEAGVYQYDLPSLGWLSVNAFSREAPVELGVSFSEQGVRLTNSSSSPVVAWGVHAYPKIAMGGDLQPGATGSLSWDRVLDSESWWAFGDAFWELNARRETNFNQNWPGVIGDLGNMAQRSGMVDTPSFVFAVLEESATHVEVGGQRQTVPGLKLTLFPIPSEQMGESGWAFARPVWLDDAIRDVGVEGDPVFAEQWILSYRLPSELPAPPRLVLGGLDPEFAGFGVGRPPPGADEFGDSEDAGGWEAWDWAALEFVPVDINRPIDPERFVAPSGEVLMKVSTARIEMPAPLAGVMTWGRVP